MQIGVINEDIWDFFSEIYQDLQENHSTELLNRRTFGLPVFNVRFNKWLLKNDMQTFMRVNDVLFFEWASDLLALASHLPKTCGIVTRMHRYDLYEWIDEVDWNQIDKIILVSQAKKREFLNYLPNQASKLVVIPEAVSLERFTNQSRAFRGNIGILCHLKPRKRVYDLILGFYELAQKSNGLHLYIGGDMRPRYKDYYEALHSLVKKLGLENQITFDGHVSDPVSWYQKIDVFISNSYSEGLQVSPMEAMASGCYCLSHHWDGAEELLPEENLFFTNSQLQEKLLQYCRYTDSERLEKVSNLRSMVCEKFNIDKTKVQIRKLIEEVGSSA